MDHHLTIVIILRVHIPALHGSSVNHTNYSLCDEHTSQTWTHLCFIVIVCEWITCTIVCIASVWLTQAHLNNTNNDMSIHRQY